VAQREGIAGRHAVLQALRSGREVHSVLMTAEAMKDPSLAELREAAGARGLTLRHATQAELVRLAGSAAQGVGAIVAPMPDFSVKDLVQRARDAGQMPLLVALDGIEDPQNLGAIARSALLAGAHGLIVPDRGTASIGAGALKAASGAFSVLPVSRVASLPTALASLRREGVWLLGADARGGRAPWRLDLRQGLCLVLGSESSGLSRATLEAVDERISLPTPGGDLSLNVSAAAAALLFEAVRQRAK
jgi:23S rRNA (guanosine2251-2'-O)-methyltransferase